MINLQVLMFTAFSTYLGFLKPSVNAFFLMTLGVPACALLIYNLRSEEEPRVTSLGKRTLCFWCAGVFCWVSDRLCCEMWSNLGFPYLHGFLHVLIFLAAYTAVVLFAYYDVKNNHPLDQARSVIVDLIDGRTTPTVNLYRSHLT